MKLTHTETVEYFEHGRNTYRRFANGYWEFAETGESFCPPDGFKEVLWVSLLGESLKNMEAIYQQPEKCKSCKYYDENPYMHCAVHPNGSDGVCGDWEEKTVKERPVENNYYHHPVGRLNDGFRDLHTVLPRPLRAPVGHDYYMDDLHPVGRINPIRTGLTYPCTREIELMERSHELGELIEFELGTIRETSVTASFYGVPHGDLYLSCMTRAFASCMNMLWNIDSCEGQTAVISGGRVVRIDAERTELVPRHTLWEHPDIVHEREVRDGVARIYQQMLGERGFPFGRPCQSQEP